MNVSGKERLITNKKVEHKIKLNVEETEMQGNKTFKSELKRISGEIQKSYGIILILKIISLILKTFTPIYN
jgi:hypothetical protein